MNATLPRAFAGLLLLSPLAVAQAQLDATYTFGVLGAGLSGFCPSGSPVELFNEYGTVTFLPNGAFSLASIETSVCVAGGYSVVSRVDNGTYTLKYDGELTLDLDPSNPGVDVAELFMSPDRQVVVERPTGLPGSPSMTFGIRQSSGMTNADLSGPFAANAFVQDVTAAGREVAGIFGSIQFDGAGNFTNAVTELVINNSGVLSTSASTDSGTYLVLPNGQITKYGSSIPVGQISPDGRFGFSMSEPGSEGELSLFVAKKGVLPTADAHEGDWALTGYGATGGSLASGVEMEDYTGDFTFDAVQNSFVFTASFSGTSNLGTSSGNGTVTGTFALMSDGSFAGTETGETISDPGWLAAGENIMIVATIDPNSGGPAITTLIRKWGSLDSDTDSVSVISGGAQTLEIRATDEFAGRPYLMLGTTTGSYPGLTLGGASIPLNYSGHLLFTLNNLNAMPFSGTFGLLDSEGKSTAAITIPPAVFASTAGAELLSALIVFNPPGFSNVIHVSQPVPLSLTL